METDKGASTRWINANKSLQNYKAYIGKKPNRFALTYIDLLYVSNFKGGNASIHEEEDIVDKKLLAYSVSLKEIFLNFNDKNLNSLSDDSIEILIIKTQQFLNLTLQEKSRIFGFKSSYASALLNAYFPTLIPILDRRVLTNLGIASRNPTTGQVDNMEIFMPALIKKFYERLKINGTTLRDLDQEFFKVAISKPSKVK